ncbi:hypothetical protein B1H10_03815, partial [candidate division KSB1 bacterium 4484_188]
GEFIIGTVAGDLHDIGKNIVKMILEGAGWKVIDLGNNVSTERFLKAVDSHPGAVVGMSALLTTTMENMEKTVRTLKEKYPGQIIVIGGAPITEDFRKRIGADAYFRTETEKMNGLILLLFYKGNLKLETGNLKLDLSNQ